MEQLTKPEALRGVEEHQILTLDVREDLRTGREPFERIMHARGALAQNGVLVLRTVFEPHPLYAVLGKQGFAHWTEKLADDDWRTWFYPSSLGGAAESAPGPAAPPTNGPAAGPAAGPIEGRRGKGPALHNCGTPRPEPSDIQVLDVRGLEPPEPMVRTLEALAALPEGHTLVQINGRVPRFLLPELDSRGFQYTVREEGEVVRVFIRRAEDVPVLDVRVLPPREKHPTIFRTFDALSPGDSFVLLNDHDPVPLKYQFQGERPDAFSWAYLEEGPEIWRVAIGKTA